MEKEFEKAIFLRALENAFKFNGKANSKAILGKILSEHPELKKDIGKIMQLIQKNVDKVNSMNLNEQKSKLEKLSSKSLETDKKVREEKELPPLPNVKNFEK